MQILLAGFFVCLQVVFVSAQVQVTGTVLTLNNRPIGGVNVLVKGTPNGTATDMNGNFRTHLPTGPSVLFFSFLKQKGLEHTLNIRPGFKYEVYVTLSDKSQTFHKSRAVSGELPDNAREVTGQVFDQDSGILRGVSVVIANTVFKRTTDVDGNFTIALPTGDNNIEFSLPGYKALRVPISGSEENGYTLNVVLVEDRSKYRGVNSNATHLAAGVSKKRRQ